MSSEFSTVPIDRLCRWLLAEYASTGQVFGIHRELFYRPRPDEPFASQRFGHRLTTPIGVAAGPHTQMTQNLIAAWLCGARYLELKTVQTLDQLKVSKPCIDAADEGYNCEWSQELRLDQSFDQYLDAWVLIHLLKHLLNYDEGPGLGCIFNLSVGYNLEGILQPNVQRFLARVADCREELAARIEAIAPQMPVIRDLAIPTRFSDNITLSTMHGCPPHEIEKIGAYLIAERKLHTTIKLNPTLLGPTELRRLLNQELGFVTEVPDLAFEHDLKYDDAVKLIRNLRRLAAENGVQFSLKLTNTLESVNHKQVFPPNEKMMYMSGRALHPISVQVARKLQREFDGTLDLSFSAGADCFNLPELIASGIRPVTVCTDLLKPGGYNRLGQYLTELRQAMLAAGARDLDGFVRHRDRHRHDDRPVAAAALANLEAYADRVAKSPAYHCEARGGDSIKTERELGPFDCVAAPCVTTCPTNQDIPQYLYHAARGEIRQAMSVILRTNPFPAVCGMVCDHLCQSKCTRINYDQPVLIREVKRYVTSQPEARFELTPAPANGLKVAVVGAGPSGLACAYFLALDGFAVEVFETKAFPGGMVADAIPSFRLTIDAIRQDIARIEALGVKIHTSARIDRARWQQLRRDFNYVYLAVGAQAAKPMGIPGEDAPGVIDCLKFLAAVRRGEQLDLGRKVVVVGGGNSAMDAARTAKRLVGAGGEVVVAYRRTRREMPADLDEVKGTLEEGITLMELVAPASVAVGPKGRVKALVAERMRLGAKDASGRARPEKIPGSRFELACDTIVPAIGQDVVLDFLGDDELRADPKTLRTALPNVFAGGDAVRGASTIVKAIGDGRRVAQTILAQAAVRHGVPVERPQKALTTAARQRKRATREFGVRVPETPTNCRCDFSLVTSTLSAAEARREAERCLYCDEICNVCVTVCPNRANVAYSVAPGEYRLVRAVPRGGTSGAAGEVDLVDRGVFAISQAPQVLNIGDFCNECGNCTTFCPTSGAPYRDKPKFYLTWESFQGETDGFHFGIGNVLHARMGGVAYQLWQEGGSYVWTSAIARAQLSAVDLAVQSVQFQPDVTPVAVDLEPAVRMGVLYRGLSQAWFR